MNLERLKIWRDACLNAQSKGRGFDISTWRGRGTTCLGGDLAHYPEAWRLGVGVDRASGGPTLNGTTGIDALLEFLQVSKSGGHYEWVLCLITGSALVYGQTPHKEITRADGIAAIEAKIKELETA
mgnify:CR=1 FL=1